MKIISYTFNQCRFYFLNQTLHKYILYSEFDAVRSTIKNLKKIADT